MFRLIKYFFPSLSWHFPTKEKILYLTFDDGPVPEVTPWVLKTLDEYNAAATFFCVGENVKKNSSLFESLKTSKHTVGNHTMNHLNGWKTNNKKYFSDVAECNEFIKSEFFRPPYGKLKFSQINFLKKKFRIIMWDVLSRDFDQTLQGENCFEFVRQNARNGSVIVFHDSIKAEKRIRVALPATLKYFSEKGYRFEAIT